MLTEQLVAKHLQDQGADYRLQEVTEWGIRPNLHLRRQCGGSVQLQVSGHSHLRGPHMVHQYRCAGQKGTAMTVLAKNIEMDQSAPTATDDLLPLHHRELTNVWHLCVVSQLHRGGEESSSAHCPQSATDYWDTSISLGGHLPHTVPQEGRQHS